MYYVCKVCGRSFSCDPEDKPKYCYYDRSDMIENISEEDASKMGLTTDRFILDLGIEFMGDMNFNVFTGMDIAKQEGKRLIDWQIKHFEKFLDA